MKTTFGLIFGEKVIDRVFESDVINTTGDWESYLPIYEPQMLEDGTDENGCYIWGTENAIETYLKFLTNKDWNLSERFVFNGINSDPFGGDPYEAGEFIRKNGVVLNDVLPLPKTYKEFITPRPLTSELIKEAKRFNYNVKQKYLWTENEDKRTSITEGLKRSPLGVSLYAWESDCNGLYFRNKGQRDNHWCVLFKETDDAYHVFDSYDQSKKKVRKDMDFEIAIQYKISKRCGLLDLIYGKLSI